MTAEIPDTFVHNWVLDSRGRVHLAQGRIEDAIADLEELGRRDERRDHPNPAAHPHRSRLALALLRQGDADRALALADEETALARRWGAPRALGIALRTRGLCERGEAGLARLRESVDVLDGSGAQLEYARSLIELGAALRRAGNRAAAQDPLRGGMELAHRCGAAPLVERAREELLATGARPRRVMRSGLDALTPSEMRIARMAADGLTNREIAQALFVTQRTVESHLTHVFQKLDIATRIEIAPHFAEPAA
jgi:DNA-binding CsgD family transcriptional regulator